MKTPSFLLLLAVLFVAVPARSDEVSLQPPASSVQLRSYGFGLIPLDGKFTRFHGWMRYDPSHPGACQVLLEIEAESLEMSNNLFRNRIIGPGMMDVERFPGLTFQGSCQGETVVGDLTMHGQTHPVTLDYTRAAGMITATGRLRRADWGITGNALVGGPVIRIRVELPDPAQAQHT
jgi:polyisoprenoid-binding protein YceI